MTRRLVMGDLGSGQWAARISKPGVDALTGDRAQMMFDSDLASTRILMAGSVTSFFSSSNSRTRVENQTVQLPAIDYEPIVFCGFINRVTDQAGNGVVDPLAGQRLASLWFSGVTNANPKDYADWAWNPSTYQLTFNAECINTWWPFARAGSQPMIFRYIVFSSRSN